jgi:hypothetical protein
MATLLGVGWGRSAIAALSFLPASKAQAAALSGVPSWDSLTIALGLASLGFASFLYARLRRQGQILSAAKRKLGEVEYQLNEAEAALQSESQLLLTWPSDAVEPQRIVGISALDHSRTDSLRWLAGT